MVISWAAGPPYFRSSLDIRSVPEALPFGSYMTVLQISSLLGGSHMTLGTVVMLGFCWYRFRQ
jgi:hypothetical protein